MTGASPPPRPTGSAWSRSAEAGLRFRPVSGGDMDLLRSVYAATRQAELALVDWPQGQKDAFVEMQFQAQHAHYGRNYPDAERLVVLHDGAPAGRLYLERGPNRHHVIDIALLPEHRGLGLGTALLLDLIGEAAAAGKAVSIHVEKFNPAKRLYARLGFVLEEDRGVYDLMLWTPQPNTAS